MTNDLVRVQQQYNDTIRRVSAAQNRYDRKIALEDPATAGPAQSMDAVVNNTSKEELEVIKK